MMRKRRSTESVGFSLFPFLAVLTCTMGVLIVVLVILVQQPVASDDPAAQLRAAKARSLREQRQEAIQWHGERRGVLIEQHRLAAQQLAGARAELSHLEDHIRRIKQDLRNLRDRLASIENAQRRDQGELERDRQRLAALRGQLAAAQRRFKQTQAKANAKSSTYAILPYRGPHGTRRRPIYVACRRDGIVLQPTGVVLRSGDLQGPLGPDNPLAQILRATREQLLASGELDEGEPYPLLIVRPDGVHAYSAARRAMKGWDSEFGYELINADVQLDFPEADARLAEIQQQVLSEARRRREFFARAAPRRFGSSQGDVGQTGPPTNGASSVVRNPAAPDAFSPTQPSTGRSGSLVGSERATGAGPAEGIERPRFGAAPGQAVTAGAATGDAPWPPPRAATGGRAAGDAVARQENPQRGARAGFSSRPPGQARGPGGASSNTNSSSGENAATGGGQLAQDNPQAPQLGNPPAGSSAARHAEAGQSRSTGAAGAQGRGAPQSEFAPPADVAQNPWAPGGPGGSGSGSRAASVAGSGRGQGRAIAFQRFIGAGLFIDRFTIPLAGGGLRTISFAQPVDQVAREIAEAIRDRVRAWGPAGPNAYWKPIVSVEVAPDALDRYHALARRLEPLGVELRRKQR